MNKLSKEKRAQIVKCLVEGMSIRATVRITGASKNTISKLLVDLGTVCSEYQDRVLRNLDCKLVECDEIWSFCYSKAKNVPEEFEGIFGYGDVWTWTAIDPQSKLVLSWLVANRTTEAATEFMEDVAGRLKNRVQLTTDGHKSYLEAVENAFGSEIDYAQLVKMYGSEFASSHSERKYSPGQFVTSEKREISGNPDKAKISTSIVERNNLTMRMSMRRFTRLTNGFSKKIENHEAAISLHFMYYNFVRIHKTLQCSPAMAAGVTDKLWEMEDVIQLLEEKER